MINFLHNFIPSPVLFQAGIITIHWYGLFVVAGIVVTLLITTRLAKQFNISSDEVYNAAFYIVISGIIGARIYSVFLDLPYYIQNLWQVLAVWQGGLAIHGGIIGVVLATLIITKKSGHSFWKWADIVAPGAALGQAIGRWGNYFNQEIFGTPTNLPWGIPIEVQNRSAQYIEEKYYHPTFLYESILNLINFVILIILFKKLKVGRGLIFLIYLINYSLIRIAMEFFRTDRAIDFFGFRWPAVISSITIIICLGLMVNRLKKKEV